MHLQKPLSVKALKIFNIAMSKTSTPDLELDDYRFGFAMPERSVHKTGTGLTGEVVREISAVKEEDDWMRDFRLKSLSIFQDKPMPSWGADLSQIDFDSITYYLKATDRQSQSWDDLPDEIKEPSAALGLPKPERKFSLVSSAHAGLVLFLEGATKR